MQEMRQKNDAESSGNNDFGRPDMTGANATRWLDGISLHPKLLKVTYVYLAYVYQFDNCLSNNGGCFFWTRIVRYTYNPANGTLGSPITMLNALPGSNDHNSGRMTIGPDPGSAYDTATFKLYYSIGDMGAGQFNNLNRTNNAQNVNVYEGKILRLNLEPDPSQSGGDEWIPDNNLFLLEDLLLTKRLSILMDIVTHRSYVGICIRRLAVI
jgi:hypothetical protein